jgi:two-component system phosphate regulon response regulator OmpR
MADDTLKHLLVVDDDERLRSLLQRYLTEHDYHVSLAADGAEARAALRNITFDLIIVDVMLPGESGVELTSGLRQTSDVPILMLTARGETADRIAGLEAGADDYLVKPFEPRELLLRIATILRRVPAAPAIRGPLRFGPFTFDRGQGELRRDGEVMHLTTGEVSLLRSLSDEPGRPVGRAELGERSGIKGADRAVDVQIARLRRKLEIDPRQPRYLITMRGEGYILRAGH